jgi:hypothetical protein
MLLQNRGLGSLNQSLGQPTCRMSKSVGGDFMSPQIVSPRFTGMAA